MEPVEKPIFGNKKWMEEEEEIESFFCKAIYPHLVHCEHCQSLIMSMLAARAGKAVTTAKQRASRANGRLGGRPRKE